MEGAMLYRKFPAYNSNVSSTIPSDNLVRSMRSFTIPITTNFGLFSQMLKVTLETFLMRRVVFARSRVLSRCHFGSSGVLKRDRDFPFFFGNFVFCVGFGRHVGLINVYWPPYPR